MNKPMALNNGRERTYSSVDDKERFTTINLKIDEVKDLTIKNMEKLIDRGDKLDVLVEKSKDLETSAKTFHKSSSKLRNLFCWKDFKQSLCLYGSIATGITVIVLIAVYSK
jgi:vesicle-associated membrane protein 7